MQINQNMNRLTPMLNICGFKEHKEVVPISQKKKTLDCGQ